MDDDKLTERLEHFDFSRLHPLKETLLNQLLSMHRRDNFSQSIWMNKMTEEELDMAVAAGNPILNKKSEE